jgi:hypothetical protein
VYRATTPHRPPPLKSLRFIALAWLLLVAQLFSQLHGLEHLEDAEYDEHSKEVCQLCILSSSLDHGSIDTVVISGAQVQVARLPNLCRNNFTSRLLTAYQGRAPPSPSSIA